MKDRVFFPSVRAGVLAGVAVAALLLSGPCGFAQAADPAVANPATQSNATPGADVPATGAPASAPTAGPQSADATLSTPETGKHAKREKVVQSKDTRKVLKREKKVEPLAGQDAKLPDKELYDKAQVAMKKGKYDVARLDLQTLLNTYPDSQYQMRAKLAFADSWYKEGGTAALTQAEAEYSDFRIFFPNTPEAAEAQMRIGDIYFRQMDKPDRDYAKATHAEEEYRRMLTDYPDSTLVPQAKQRLREVQEALATREASIGAYYGTRDNWPATIARYQTVVDTYPQFSHMDDVLLGLGDAYSAEARAVRVQRQMPEAAKARLEKIYDDQAAAAYRKIILEHSATARVEDARDRLEAMNLPIPTPTLDQTQASQVLENSRAQYRLQDRAKLLVFHQPDVVAAARVGDPTLVDPKATLAPEVTKQLIADFNGALNPNARVNARPIPSGSGTPDAAGAGGTTAAPAPLAFQDVPASDAAAPATDAAGSVTEATPAATGARGASTGNGAASLGAEIITPSSTPAATGAGDSTGGLRPVGPPNSTALPAIEKAAPAPDAVNDVPAGSQPAAQTATPGKKKQPAPGFDKGDESSSKHKKKKGLDKLNPF